MGNKAPNHRAEPNGMRLGCWTGAEISDRKDLECCVSQSPGARAGYGRQTTEGGGKDCSE